jgi:hypothetical protein
MRMSGNVVGRVGLTLALGVACACTPADRRGGAAGEATATRRSNLLASDGTGAFSWGSVREEWGVGVAQGANGDALALGDTYTVDPGISKIAILSVGANALSWARSWGAAGLSAGGGAIATGSDGSIYVAGSAQITSSSNSYEMVVLKLDEGGDVVWAKRLHTGTFDSANALAFDAAGNIVVAGSSEVCNASCVNTTILMKLTTAGSLLWSKSYQRTAYADSPFAIAVDANGNVIVVGSTTELTHAPIFVLKTDTDGNLLWERDWGDPTTFNTAAAVTTDASGNIYLGGSMYHVRTISGFDRSSLNPVLVKLTPAGDQVWATTDDKNDTGFYGGVAIDAKGRLFVAGVYDDSPQEYFLDHFDTDGNFQDRQVWPVAGPGTEAPSVSMVLGANGNALLVGTAASAAGSWTPATPSLSSPGDLVATGTLTNQDVTLTTSDSALATVAQTFDVDTGGGSDDLLLLGLALPATGAPTGAPCSTGADCQNGLCVDGVCCQTSCDGGTNDCQACSIAAGGSANGQCTPVASTQACTGTDFCDAATVCSGTAPMCPDSPMPTSMCAVASEDTMAACGYFDPMYPACVPLGGWPSTPGSTIVKLTVPYAGRIKLVDLGAASCAPPTGFQVVGTGHYWDFETDPAVALPDPLPNTELFNLCFKYSDAWVSGIESNLFIMHGATGSCSGQWTQLDGKTVDTTNNVVCANSPSLSPFTIVQPVPEALPVVTIPGDITASATSTGGAVVTFAASAVDQQGGALAVTCAPASGGLFPVGTTPVTCSATDSRQFTGAASFTVHVRYAAPTDGTFFAQPINPDGSSVFKCGSTIPVKFSLTGVSAGITNLAAHISVARISNGIEGTYVETTSNAAPDGGSLFRYSGGQYIYNLSTKGMATGTWSIRADLGDGVAHTIIVSLK